MSESVKKQAKKKNEGMLVKKGKEYKNDIHSRYALHVEQFYVTLYILQYPLIPLDLLFLDLWIRYVPLLICSTILSFLNILNRQQPQCMHAPDAQSCCEVCHQLSSIIISDPRPAPFILHSKRWQLISAPWTAASILLLWHLERARSSLQVWSLSSLTPALSTAHHLLCAI